MYLFLYKNKKQLGVKNQDQNRKHETMTTSISSHHCYDHHHLKGNIIKGVNKVGVGWGEKRKQIHYLTARKKSLSLISKAHKNDLDFFYHHRKKNITSLCYNGKTSRLFGDLPIITPLKYNQFQNKLTCVLVKLLDIIIVIRAYKVNNYYCKNKN